MRHNCTLDDALPLPRTLSHFARQASATFPVLLLTGARQVGKTTLLKDLREPDRGYVTLDDPLALQLARTDPALFLTRFPPPVLIDEVQYAPELFAHIKMAVDTAPTRHVLAHRLAGIPPHA